MKLLLTSAGITNKSIANAFFDLTEKKPEDISLVFIPTASNVEIGDKEWLIDDLVNLKNLNLKSIDIADISAVPENIWRPKLEQADVLFFGGGNEYYLMDWINKSGLSNLLLDLLKTRLYVGLSAGSMVTGKDLSPEVAQMIYDEDATTGKKIDGLNFVDFYFMPHLNSPHFKVRKEGYIKEIVKDIYKKIYVLDDNSALKVVDGKVEVVSEGKWFLVNN